MMRSLRILAELANGDLFDGVITLAIVQVNVGHLPYAAGSEFAHVAEPPPNPVRRPATVAAVADNLGLPYETVRRQIRRLEARGLCRRVPGGTIVPVEVLQSEQHAASLGKNLANLRQMYRALRAAGVRLD